jgi:type IV pilus assembly protein PilP
MRKGDQLFALIRAGGTVYRVKQGNYVGRNYGIVTGVTDTGVRLKELVPGADGDWVERDRVLKMEHALRGK